ncbi:MAG: phytanoyl-CoA dioxygenase family protein [Ilumatobacteraceae bacterium]|nr:phytanoyl-CoA dioxygenase family protein [Ilumatobacteraceae bacterium]
MVESLQTCALLENVLADDDLVALKQACQRAMRRDDPIPSYVMLDDLASPVYQKVHRCIDETLGEQVFYLNDFYLYSDESFGAPWHMDTELFTFARCVNAWILLSPGEIESPLSFIDDMNAGADVDFHSVSANDEDFVFTNYRTRKRLTRSRDEVDEQRVDAPTVKAGDILLIDPKRFHRTKTTVPKHALVFKFLLKGENGFMSDYQVPPMFWAEIAIFKDLVENSAEWSDVLDGIRGQLRTEHGRTALSAGFFPDRIELYRKMAATL